MTSIARTGAVIGRELVTTDPARAAQFYCDLLGWSIDADTMAEHGFARLLRDSDGLLVGSVMPLGEAPSPRWLTWWGVADVDAAVATARDLGATVLDGPADSPGIGRYAWLTDPAGAHVGLLAATPAAAGPGLSPQVSFDELVTADPARATEFYVAILGWTALPMPTASGLTYTLYLRAGALPGDHPVAGMLPLMQGMPESLWTPYVWVDDLDATRRRTVALGGNEISPVITIPRMGRLVWIADPTGAIVQLVEPDRSAGPR